MILKTAAASATKWQSASCLLIFALAISLNAQDSPPQSQPTAVTCSIGKFQEKRPEKYQLMLRKTFADGHASVEWHSEHDSRKAAMKECESVLKAQDKIWKSQISKGNQK